jgi:YD repeat-containing protein
VAEAKIETKATFDRIVISDISKGSPGIDMVTEMDWLGRKTAYSDLDRGRISFECDANGNLTRQVDAKGQVLYLRRNQPHDVKDWRIGFRQLQLLRAREDSQV